MGVVISYPRPLVDYVAAEGAWYVLEDWLLRYGNINILIPKGTRSDLASIHRVLWPVIAPFELSIPAVLPHDYLYQHLGWAPGTTYAFTRQQVDTLFLQIMELEGVKEWRRRLAYPVVSALGEIPWRNYHINPSPARIQTFSQKSVAV